MEKAVCIGRERFYSGKSKKYFVKVHFLIDRPESTGDKYSLQGQESGIVFSDEDHAPQVAVGDSFEVVRDRYGNFYC